MIRSDSVIRAVPDKGAGEAVPKGTESDLERATIKLLEANRELRQHLDSYDYIVREGLEKHRSGMRIRDVIRTMSAADATIGSELEVVAVFEARREFRRILVAALLADGMAVNQIASTFNVSVESICDLATDLGIPTD